MLVVRPCDKLNLFNINMSKELIMREMCCFCV